MPREMRQEIAAFCNVEEAAAVVARDAPSIYGVPLNFYKEGVDALAMKYLRLETKEPDMSKWEDIVRRAYTLPYIMVHGGLLTPLFAMIILGLSGPSALASLFSWEPLVAVGASTYALYLLHFNVYLLLHDYHVLDKLHLARFDPWISYVLVILLAVAVRKWVEHPAQQAIGRWWKQRKLKLAEADALSVR